MLMGKRVVVFVSTVVLAVVVVVVVVSSFAIAVVVDGCGDGTADDERVVNDNHQCMVSRVVAFIFLVRVLEEEPDTLE